MKNLVFLFSFLVLATGCAVGPKITLSEKYDNTSKLKADKVIIPVFTIEKKIVRNKLTGFSSYSNPVNNTSTNIYEFTITSDVYSNNISVSLSNYFKSKGIKSESYTKIDVNKLGNNDYILYGGAVISPVNRAMPWEVFTFFTVLPVVLPMPFTSKYGVYVYYHFQIMDKNGKYLQQKKNSIKVMYGSHYWPVGLIRSSNVPEFAHNAAEKELYKVLAEEFVNELNL